MNKKFYAVLVLLFPCLLFAQSNYKAGVVVNLQGDTIQGFINYKEWSRNPVSIDFKSEMSAAPKRLSTNGIQFFRVNGYIFYRKYTVSISMSSTEVQQLGTIPDTSSKTATVFLKIIQSGKKATLFSYKDDLKTRFYILDNTSAEPRELGYLLYLNPENRDNIITRKIYQGQLSLIAGNSHMDLESAIAGADYDEHSLAGIVAKINGGQNMIATPDAQNALRFYLGISGESSTLTFNGNPATAVITGSSAAFAPQLAAGFDLFLNPNVERIAIRVELSASSASYSYASDYENEPNSYIKTSAQLKQFNISLSPMLVYNVYNTTPLKVYLSAGLKLNFPLYPTNNYSVTSSTLVNGGNASNINSLPMESFYVSIPVKIGIMINRHVDIYAGYYFSSSPTTYDAKLAGYQGGINYFFGK